MIDLSILGDDSSFSNLSKSERDVLLQVLSIEMQRREDCSKPMQIKEIVPIEKWLESDYYLGPNGVYIYDYWKEMISDIFGSHRDNSNRVNEVIMSGCFTGDTKISLLDGRELSMLELVEEYGMREHFWVYSCDDRGNVVPGKAFNVRKTKVNQTIIEITLDNGEKVKSTLDHKFLLRDNTYKMADELEVGQSLMPLYREYTQQGIYDKCPEGYERLYNPNDGKYYLTHSVVSREVHSEEIKELKSNLINEHVVTHHKDFNKRNNEPSNLKPMGHKEHIKYHGEVGFHTLWNTDGVREKWCENSREKMNKLWRDVEFRAMMDKVHAEQWDKLTIEGMIEKLKEWWNSPSGMEERNIRRNRLAEWNNQGNASRIANDYWSSDEGTLEKEKRSKKRSEQNKDPNFSKRVTKLRGESVRKKNREYYQSIGLTLNELSRAVQMCNTWDEVAERLNFAFGTDFSRLRLEKLFKAYDIEDKNDFRDKVRGVYKNHKITSIRILSECEDVYDFEVEEHHNFALSSGVFVSNSIGIGKSTCANIIMLRKMYELSCYRNVTSLFNLMRTSNIVFLYFSVNKNQAQLTGFGDMVSLIDSIPYFKEEFPRNDKIDSLILLPENMMMTFGSGTQHAIGMNMLGSILDEANFFGGEGKESSLGNDSTSSRVAELYSSIVNRSKSRFVMDGGIDNSLNILVSSSTHETSFTEQRIQAGLDDVHTVVRCPTLWDVKPKAYSGKKFYVFKGNNSLDPYIVTNIDDLNQYKISEGLGRCSVDESISDNGVIEKEIKDMPELFSESFLGVPIELKKGFESNLLQSLQDIGGVSVAPTGRLFSSKPVYYSNCVDYIKHPFVSQSITISTGDGVMIQDFLRRGHYFKDLDKPRYIHIDQSLTTDCTGISSVYLDGFMDDGDGVKKPIIGVDFMIQIVPPKAPKKIAIYKIRDFIIYLNRVLGFKYGKVTYDIFNSEESRQILSELGYNVAYSSVDRTDKAYVDFVTLLYEERMRMYDYEPARKELFALVHNRVKRKVDHPKKNGDGSYGCFLGDTKIKLLNGTSVRIDELVGKDGVELYGCMEDGTIVPTVAKKIFKTKEVDRYIKLTLDNGEEIKCTLEHRFMLRDGSYKEAQYLEITDSLMPLYYDYNGKFLKGYERVKDNKTNRWRYTHSLVSDFYNGSLPKGYLVHHYDIKRLNNTRDNLKVMTREEHSRVHAMLSSLGCSEENLKKRIGSLKRGVRLRNGLPSDYPLSPYEYRNELSKGCYSVEDRKSIEENPYVLVDMMCKRLESYRKKVLENKNKVKDVPYLEKVRLDKGLPKDFPIPPYKFESILSGKYLSKDDRDVITNNPYMLLDDEFIDMLEIKKIMFKSDMIVERNKSDEQRKISSNTITKTNTSGWWSTEDGRVRRKELSSTQLVDARKSRMDREDKEWIDSVDKTIPIVSVRQMMGLYGGGYSAVERRLSIMDVDLREGYLIVKDFSDSKLESIGLSRKIISKIGKTFNHKIVSKEIIECDNVPVYDIEVPLTSNFALDVGVFVHNSKDVMDSLVGAVHNALTSEFADNMKFDGVDDFRIANPMFSTLGVSNVTRDTSTEDDIDRMLGGMLGDLLGEYDIFDEY